MPSKEDLHFIHETKCTTQDFLARDVDELVAEIKENLRLRTRPCHSICKQRASPYKIPGRTQDSKCNSCGSPKCMRTCHKKPHADSSEPYELLQMLLREGSLIKEAVKRLQMGVPDTKDDRHFYEDCETHTPRTKNLEV